MRKLSGLLIHTLLMANGLVLQAQTKLINHKSHSGSGEHFKLAYEGNFSDLENSNIGEYRPRDTLHPVTFATLTTVDSVILLTDTTIAVITWNTKYRDGLVQKVVRKKDTIHHKLPDGGKNGMVNEIRNQLKNGLFFSDSTRYIDNRLQVDTNWQQLFVPVGHPGDDNNTSSGSHSWQWLVFITLFAAMAAYLCHFMQKGAFRHQGLEPVN